MPGRDTKREAGAKLTLQNVRDRIVGIDREVPLLGGSRRRYVNLDNAATTPALQPVAAKVDEFLAWYSSVHRGAGFKSRLSTEVYDRAHDIVCDFLGARRETNTVIFLLNSTAAVNRLARRLPLAAEDVVLSTLMEHHSNDLPWRRRARVVHVGLTDRGDLDLAHLDELLALYAGRVRLLAVTGASNVTGAINPVHRLAARAHAAGAQILVDATQLAARCRIDVRPDDDPGHLDYVVLSAHKMYAPFGTGALIGPRHTFLGGDPADVGGGTTEFVTPGTVSWTGLPDREEAGSPNVVGAVAMAVAALCLQELGPEKIAAHEADLTAHLLAGLARIPEVRVHGDPDPAGASTRVGVVPFEVEGLHHGLVAAVLGAEGGIGVRNGCFCAHSYLQHLLRISPARLARHHEEIRSGSRAELPGLVRVSLGCYNERAEIDHFLGQLERLVRGRYEGRYVQDGATGDFRAEGFDGRMERYFSLQPDGG